MYMGRMIRIELYRAFHGKELKTAMLLGGLLGLAHFVLEVIPSVSHIFDGYHPDIASSVVGDEFHNPRLEIRRYATSIAGKCRNTAAP
jgi:hypothetical protein